MNEDAALAKIQSDIARHRELFDLTRDKLGADLCKAATDGVQANLANETQPDGNRLADLSTAYDEWKQFHYPGQQISYLHGVMDNPREVAGEVAVSTDQAEVTYGVSEQARQEYDRFSAGNDHQPPRPTWGFTRASESEARTILDARFATA